MKENQSDVEVTKTYGKNASSMKLWRKRKLMLVLLLQLKLQNLLQPYTTFNYRDQFSMVLAPTGGPGRGLPQIRGDHYMDNDFQYNKVL